ncbi:MAG: DUF1565 domain-containing protein, partial [Candidatus Cloacimonetes bacterium]|nr:DUF1565 domain-containing protein [Candidatus Cloacimonadota bacterium]
MKKYLYLTLFIFFSTTIFSQILEVCLSGEKPYTSIQDAINAAPNNAIVRVYAGDYYGELTIPPYKSLTLESLYATTGDTLYIHNTRLLANFPEMVMWIGPPTSFSGAYNDYYVNINGFTVSNNLDNVMASYYPGFSGGGIRVYRTNVNIENNIFRNNLSTGWGSGLTVLSPETRPPILCVLKNNKIFDNFAYSAPGGGLGFEGNVNIVFSQEERNSIYNNVGLSGQDIHFANPMYNYEIYLDLGSRIVTEIDHNYFSIIGLHYYPTISVNILRESLPPFVNNDLFVAPWGDDNNSGLSPEAPLKTIYYATSVIYSDEINPKTIHLLPGSYTRESGQIFPIFIPRWTIVKGAGMG